MAKGKLPKNLTIQSTPSGFEIHVPEDRRMEFLMWWSNVQASQGSPDGQEAEQFGKIHGPETRCDISADELARVCRIDQATADVKADADIMPSFDDVTKCMVLLYANAVNGIRSLKAADLFRMLLAVGGDRRRRLDHQLLKRTRFFGTEGAKRGKRYGLSEAGVREVERILAEHKIGNSKVTALRSVVRK